LKDNKKSSCESFIKGINKKIESCSLAIKNTTDNKLLKITYIYMFNGLVTVKNLKIFNHCVKNDQEDEFMAKYNQIIEENEIIKKENQEIAKNGFQKELIPLKEYKI